MNWTTIRNSFVDHYGCTWQVTAVRNLTAAEKPQIKAVKVVDSMFGKSLAFTKWDLTEYYIPLAANSHLRLGDYVTDFDTLKVVTYSTSWESVFRVIEKEYAPKHYKANKVLRTSKKWLWYNLLKPIRDIQYKIQGKKPSLFEELTLY